MKRLLLLYCCLVCCMTVAAQSIVLNRSNLNNNVDKKWRFLAADSSVFASPDYNDDHWQLVSSRTLPIDSLNGVVWLRLHVAVDSYVASKAIALRLTQLGASEVFVDGKRVARYGIIATKDSVEYEDPRYTPLIIDFDTTGDHLIAIRYVNYDARRNREVFGKMFSGIDMLIYDARTAIEFDQQSRLAQTFVATLLFGVFIAFALLHLLMFLYHRQEVSNISFSMFSLMLALMFLIFLIARFSVRAELQLKAGYTVYFTSILACVFLHMFLQQIFRRNRIGQWVIYSLALVAVVWRFVNYEQALLILIALIGAVSLETVVSIVMAVIKKVKGASIIGFGLFCFTGLILLIMLITIASGGNVEIGDDSESGFYWFLGIVFTILSIPISMSAYLAYRFSYINRDLQEQLKRVQLLSEKTIQQEQEKKKILEQQNEELEKQVNIRTTEVRMQKEQIEYQHEALKSEKKKSDDLLLNILPAEVAEELKAKGTTTAKLYDQVTVLFTDFVDFTIAGERMGAQELVNELDHCFKAFDEIISRYGIEKIKTIGDAYLAVCGLPNSYEDHALRAVKAASEIHAFMEQRKQILGERTFRIRIGMHSGPVVAGIVGVKKFAYDIWGDTVNTAARMEQSSEPGKINISETTYELIRDHFDCQYRGEIEAKNKGALKMYFVEPSQKQL